MTNNLNIDVSKGKLDQKEKGSLLPIECKSIEETRRYNLERLASVSYTHLTLPTNC